jgi:hypothetical protein
MFYLVCAPCGCHVFTILNHPGLWLLLSLRQHGNLFQISIEWTVMFFACTHHFSKTGCGKQLWGSRCPYTDCIVWDPACKRAPDHKRRWSRFFLRTSLTCLHRWTSGCRSTLEYAGSVWHQYSRSWRDLYILCMWVVYSWMDVLSVYFMMLCHVLGYFLNLYISFAGKVYEFEAILCWRL